MESTFLTGIRILNVRGVRNREIPLSKTKRNHLIITGKNGCGKTSVLVSLAEFMKYLVSDDYEIDDSEARIAHWKLDLWKVDYRRREEYHKNIKFTELYARRRWKDGCIAEENTPMGIREKFRNGQFILAYYADSRRLDMDPYRDIVKMDMKQVYGIDEHPAQYIGKYLANLKFAQAFAKLDGDTKRARDIEKWFQEFQKVLRRIYDDKKLELKFDTETYQFSIQLSDGKNFALNCMSMGYAAVFDIVGDLLMRMSNRHACDMEGIVLIDEVETHLHVKLQREVLPILTTLFPNIQFIVTSHSPFVLSSVEDAVIYDLEQDIATREGITMLPYEAIVEEHFGTSRLSQIIWGLFQEYKEALEKWDGKHDRHLRKLEEQLDSIPEFLAQDFVLEYQMLRLDNRR